MERCVPHVQVVTSLEIHGREAGLWEWPRRAQRWAWKGAPRDSEASTTFSHLLSTQKAAPNKLHSDVSQKLSCCCKSSACLSCRSFHLKVQGTVT